MAFIKRPPLDVSDRYVVSCTHNGCRLKEISTYERCQAIASAHTLATGHREIVIVSYKVISYQSSGAIAT